MPRVLIALTLSLIPKRRLKTAKLFFNSPQGSGNYHFARVGKFVRREGQVPVKSPL